MRGIINCKASLLGSIKKAAIKEAGLTNTIIECEVIPLEYKSTSSEIVGNTLEVLNGTKSLDNASKLLASGCNGIMLYSLPDGTHDSLEISEEGIEVSKLCGYIKLDSNITIATIISSGDSRVASGFFAVGYSKTVFGDELISAGATNIYCNRMEVSTLTALKSITSTALYINSIQAMYVVLPTGTCAETKEGIAEWLDVHPVEIIYPIETTITYNESEVI